MYPWIIVGLFLAGIYYLIDRVVRRTKWKDNTPEEKKSMTVGMVCMSIYAFFSVVGIFVGIVGAGHSELAQLFHRLCVAMGAAAWAVALGVTLVSIWLRKKQKTKASTLIHILGVGYMVLLVAVMAISDFLP